MASIHTRLTRKLHLAFGLVLLITLGVAWFFFDSARDFDEGLKRIARSNEVLHAYQALDNRMLARQQSIFEVVASGSPGGPGAADTLTLREAMARVRQAVETEAFWSGDPGEVLELENLAVMERHIERIIAGGEAIDAAMQEGSRQRAEQELSRLRSDGAPQRFEAMLAQAAAAQQRQVNRAHEDVVALAEEIRQWLPATIAAVTLVALVLVSLFTRSLTRGLRTLHEAVTRFTSGNLKHRIPPIGEFEFDELGQAFNTMAQELQEHRTRLHDTNIRLEAMVAERTSALQDSNRKLAEVDENRRKLLADISHEFRTPLTVIRGESEIALRGVKTESEYRDSLQRIISQADNTTRLVDDLLFIARADAGESRLDKRAVVLARLVEEICKDFHASAMAKEISIDFEGRDIKTKVTGDVGRLRQVFTILLDNAVRYSHPGGKIAVSVSARDRDVRVTVRDQGIGLTDAEAEQAFERFYRGERAAGHARGTGLGLPVAKAIVEAHGGTISLKGKPGTGAEASVILPQEDALRVVA